MNFLIKVLVSLLNLMLLESSAIKLNEFLNKSYSQFSKPLQCGWSKRKVKNFGWQWRWIKQMNLTLLMKKSKFQVNHFFSSQALSCSFKIQTFKQPLIQKCYFVNSYEDMFYSI